MLLDVDILRHFTMLIISQPFVNNKKTWFSGKNFKRVIHWMLTETGIIYMADFSLTRSGHSEKIITNAPLKFAYRCNLRLWIFRNNFICICLTFISENKNHRSNYFLFHMFHTVKLFNKLGKVLIIISCWNFQKNNNQKQRDEVYL